MLISDSTFMGQGVGSGVGGTEVKAIALGTDSVFFPCPECTISVLLFLWFLFPCVAVIVQSLPKATTPDLPWNIFCSSGKDFKMFS